MKVLVDADFLLEALLNREKSIGDARKLWKLLETDKIEGVVTDIGLQRICIHIDKFGGSKAVKEITSVLKSIVQVKIVDREILEEARSFDSLDFESAVEIVCAYAWKVDAIVTQNIQQFYQAELPVLSISEVLKSKPWQHLRLVDVLIKTRSNVIPFARGFLGIVVPAIAATLVFAEPLNYPDNLMVRHKLSFLYSNTIENILASLDFDNNSLDLTEEYNGLKKDFYDYSEQNTLISSDFEDNPFKVKEEDHSIRSDFDDNIVEDIVTSLDFCDATVSLGESYYTLASNFYEVDTNILNLYLCNFNIQNVYLPENEDLTLSIFEGLDLLGFDYSFTSAEVDYLFTSAINAEVQLSASNQITVSIDRTVSEPSAIIALGALVALGLGYNYKTKRNKQNNSNNNGQKSSVIPPIANLDFMVDNSTNNKGNG